MAKLVSIERGHNSSHSRVASGKAKNLSQSEATALSGVKLPYAVALLGVSMACLGVAVVYGRSVSAENERRPSQARNQTQRKLSGFNVGQSAQK